jgi:hypothetical protein
VTTPSNTWSGKASTEKVTACPSFTPPISASSTEIFTFTRSKSRAMRNRTGAWKLAATVWPGSMARRTTIPSIGEMMRVRDRSTSVVLRLARLCWTRALATSSAAEVVRAWASAASRAAAE